MGKSYIKKMVKKERKQKCRDILKKEVLICVDYALDIFFENLNRVEEDREFISNKEFFENKRLGSD